MYQMYAADPRARINLGIRRRLAPLMENDLDTIKLMNSLLLSMPGSPIVYYGDEIGMGDNIFLGDRNGVRTPMQWSPDRNAGFSRADPQRLYLPPIMDPIYGYEAVNVEAQTREPASLLNWMKRMLAVRKTSRAFGRGKLTFLRPGNRKILAYLRELGDEAILCVANLGRSAQPVELDLARFKGRVPLELLGRTPFPPIGELPYMLTLPAHGFYWFRLATDVAGAELARRAPRARRPADPHPLRRLDELLPRPRRAVAHRHGGEDARAARRATCCRATCRSQRWYAAKGEPIKARAALRSRAVGSGRRRVDDRDSSAPKARAEAARLLRAARARVGRHRRRAHARARAGHGRARAAAGERRRAGRRVRRRALLPRARGGDRARRRGRRPRAARCASRRRGRIAELAGRDVAALPVEHPARRRAATRSSTLRRAPVPQGLPARCAAA